MRRDIENGEERLFKRASREIIPELSPSYVRTFESVLHGPIRDPLEMDPGGTYLLKLMHNCIHIEF